MTRAELDKYEQERGRGRRNPAPQPEQERVPCSTDQRIRREVAGLFYEAQRAWRNGR